MDRWARARFARKILGGGGPQHSGPVGAPRARARFARKILGGGGRGTVGKKEKKGKKGEKREKRGKINQRVKGLLEQETAAQWTGGRA